MAKVPRRAFRVCLGFLLLAGCAESSAPERLLARGAETHYELRLGGTLAGRLTVRRAVRGNSLSIAIVSILDPPGGGRLRTERDYRYRLAPPHELLHGQQRVQLPQGALFRQPLRTPATLEAWLAGATTAGAEGAVLDEQGGLLSLRRGESFLLQRVAEAPELPAAPPTLAPLTLPLAPGPTASETAPLALRLSGPAARLWPPSAALPQGSPTEDAVLLIPQAAPPVPEALRAPLTRAMEGVRAQLRYVPGAYLPTLDNLPPNAAGDCYEFAALLQRALDEAGFENSTRLGLALNAEGTGFALHAWNVVFFEGESYALDATLNRLPAPSTHLPFPDDPAQQLDLQLALAKSQLAWVNGF
jgi:hypothetical protein